VAESPQVCGEALNLAGGSPVSIKALVELILELLGLNSRTNVTFTKESWQGDVAMLLVDDAKIRRLLGFTPQVSLREGLLKLIHWLETRRGWKLSLLKSR
jgi:nucleoside-diphosphate-sugar epimerase